MGAKGRYWTQKFFGEIFLENVFGRIFFGELFWEVFFGRNSLFTLLKSAKLLKYGSDVACVLTIYCKHDMSNATVLHGP